MGARPVTPEQDTCAQTSVHQSILNFFDEKGKPKGGHYRMASLLRQNRQGWKIRVSKTRCFEKLRQQQEQFPVWLKHFCEAMPAACAVKWILLKMTCACGATH